MSQRFVSPVAASSDRQPPLLVLVRFGSVLRRAGSADDPWALTERSHEQLTVRPGETQRSMPRVGVMTIEFREAPLARMWRSMIPWRWWPLCIGLALGGVLLMQAPGNAGVLNASWTAPTTNTDGSALTSLALYRVYYSTSGSPCPGSSFVQVATSTSIPPPNQTVSFQLTGLTTGSTYGVSVTAVDTDGKESACSAVASAIARGDSTVTPTGTVSFGNVTIGSSATRTFTVQSTGIGTTMGTASVPAPFSIDSGSPFTLDGAGATATVTVRFTPTSTAAASTSVSLTVNGDMQSRLVTGTGTTASKTTPPLSEVTSPRQQAPTGVERPTPQRVPGSTPASEPRGQRQQLPRSPGTRATVERPSNDANDPRAVIDWLLMRGR